MSTWFRIEEDFSSFFDYFHTTLKNHKTNFSNGISVNWLLCHFLCSNTFWTLYIIQKKTLLLSSTFFNHLNINLKMWHHPSSINFLHLSKRKPLKSFIDIRQLLVLILLNWIDLLLGNISKKILYRYISMIFIMIKLIF